MAWDKVGIAHRITGVLLLILAGGCNNFSGGKNDSVFIQENDGQYHATGCPKLGNQAKGYDKENVIQKGYTPCPVCLGGTSVPVVEESPAPAETLAVPVPDMPVAYKLPPRPPSTYEQQQVAGAQQRSVQNRNTTMGQINQRVSMEFENMSLEEIIPFVRESYGVQVACDPQVAKWRVQYVKVTNKPLPEAMQTIARAVKANAYIQGNAIRLAP